MCRQVISLCVVAMAGLIVLPAYAIQLDFYQVDWMGDTGAGMPTYVSQDSDWGRVEVTLTSADHGQFVPMILQDGTNGWGGYINVVTNSSGLDDWDIYNLPIFYENPLELDGRLPQGVLFNLGVASGVDVAALDYGFTVNPMPLPTMGPLPTASSLTATVNTFEILNGGDKLYLFGKLMESGGMASPQPAADFPGAESGERIANRAAISVPETSVAGVNEDVNGCAPGSVARSIDYMAQANQNVNKPSGAQTMYGQLRTAMGTTALGTATSGILSGKNTFVQNNGLPIVSAQTQNFKAAMDTLKNNGDVEVGMAWGTGSDGKSLGAHRAFVSEIQELQDASGNTTGWVVKTVDDSKQGDGNATNATHTARFDAAGNLIQYDGQGTASGAGLINFQTENVYASTVVLEFPWFGSVTYRVPPGGSIPTPFGSIPVGRPGETTTIGGIRVRFENAAAEGAAVVSELAFNPQALPGPLQTMDMSLDVDLFPIDPAVPSFLNVALHFDHFETELGDIWATMLPVVSGEQGVFLENIIAGGSFFDITYRIESAEGEYKEGDGFQVYSLHGEVAEPFLETVWLEGTEAIAPPPGPDWPAESFFDVFFRMSIQPEAYPLLGEMGEPGLTTLFNMQLTAVEVPDMKIGDANGDGFVDGMDAALLAEHWLTMDGTATWYDGDFNDDGIVNDTDAALLAANWTGPCPPIDGAVPEPAGTIMLLVGGLCLLLRSRIK